MSSKITNHGRMVYAPKELINVAEMLRETENIFGRVEAMKKIAWIAEREINERRRRGL